MRIDKYSNSKILPPSNKNDTYIDSNLDEKIIDINKKNRHTIATHSYKIDIINHIEPDTILNNLDNYKNDVRPSYDVDDNDNRYSFNSQIYSPTYDNRIDNNILTPNATPVNMGTNYGIYEDDSFNNSPLYGNEYLDIPVFPMLDDRLLPFINNGEVIYNKSLSKSFYRIECIGSFIYSFLYANNVLLIANFDMQNIYLIYGLKIIFDNFSLLIVLYTLTNVSTYKSINITLEYLIINSVVYNYSLLTVTKYILLNVLSAIIGNLLFIGICYANFNRISIELILRLLNPSFISIYNYMLISTISYILFLIPCILIIANGTSLSCKETVLKKILLIFFIDIIFVYNLCSIGNIIRSWTFRIAYSIIFQNNILLSNTDLYIYLGYTILIYLLSIIIIKYFNTKFKTWYARYIEY